jgi:hypothetical protein
MDYEIRSLLFLNDQFMSIDDASAIPDKHYVTGAIVWRIGNKEILTERQADLVDQLWAYIINGLEVLKKEGSFETYFPDQALLLRFIAVDGNRCIITVGDRHFTINSSLMIKSLCQGARHFFTRMRALFPENETLWKDYLSKVDKLSM